MVAGANGGTRTNHANSLGITHGREEIRTEGQEIDSEDVR